MLGMVRVATHLQVRVMMGIGLILVGAVCFPTDNARRPLLLLGIVPFVFVEVLVVVGGWCERREKRKGGREEQVVDDGRRSDRERRRERAGGFRKLWH